MGDRVLFGEYDFCLNLGGIANASFEWEGKRIAFDICPANMLLNYLVKDLGLDYDKGGELAKKGSENIDLLNQLNALPYYQLPPPKSLGWEWFETIMIPILEKCTVSIEDKLKTAVVHIAKTLVYNMTAKINNTNQYRILLAGGGAKNHFLIHQIQDHLPTNLKLVIPSEKIIDFKEALVFAFLGVLKDRQEINCLASVTGANKDNCGGIIYLP